VTDHPRAWHADEPGVAIPVAKPLLPSADELLPYLREIDATRRYANRGPLVQRFEARLAERLGGSDGDRVTLLANGTAALTEILAALAIPAGRLCMMPAWTFAATAHAALQAGLVPWFADVDPLDGALTPEIALDLLARAPRPLGAVLAVAPFGLPTATDAWVAFRERTGIPVALDAAAAFDSVRTSAIPTAVSLHATKTLGVGEGGFVTWSDAGGIRSIRQRANFGFLGSREATLSGTNAKMAEYAAAAGLAALGIWPAARADFMRVARDYRNAFAGAPEIAFQRGYGERWISSTTVVRVPPDRLDAIEDALTARGIGSRRWWGDGLASHRAFAHHPSAPLPVTAALARTALGLPCWRDLPGATIASIAETVLSACRGVPT
jgi:dTDP-4-amino-4,6-dideoxygalactose transaminase